jgi:hypothetical protein
MTSRVINTTMAPTVMPTMAPTVRAKAEWDGGEAVPIATTKVDEEDWSSVEECWVCVSEFGWLVELEDEVG